jgi:hypothetical protein
MFDSSEFMRALSEKHIPLLDTSIEYSKLTNKIKWRFKRGS